MAVSSASSKNPDRGEVVRALSCFSPHRGSWHSVGAPRLPGRFSIPCCLRTARSSDAARDHELSAEPRLMVFRWKEPRLVLIGRQGGRQTAVGGKSVSVRVK